MPELWVAFGITDRCQLSCRHCLRDPGRRPLDLDADVFRSVLEQASALYHCDHVGLTGGEPTLHPRFGDLLTTIVDLGYTWHMVSNGQRFAERMLPLLESNPWIGDAITSVNFSLDGATEAVNDHIRGAGTYRRVMQAVTHCRERHIPYLFQMTLNAYNADQIEALCALGSDLGAERVNFGMSMATGTMLDDEMALPAAEWRRLSDKIKRLAETLRLTVTMTEPFCSFKPYHACDVFRGDSLYVDERGHLMLCCQLAGVAGDADPRVDFGDLGEVPLDVAHDRLLATVHEYQRERLGKLRKQPPAGWDLMHCNACLRHFGKAYWEDGGSTGARARRERWHGAWDPERRFGRNE